MYGCHSQTDGGFYLKSQSPVVRLISCLPKSNKGMKDDYLIVSGAWHDGLHCPTQERKPGGDTLELGPLVKHFRYSNPHHVVIILYFALSR